MADRQDRPPRRIWRHDHAVGPREAMTHDENPWGRDDLPAGVCQRFATRHRPTGRSARGPARGSSRRQSSLTATHYVQRRGARMRLGATSTQRLPMGVAIGGGGGRLGRRGSEAWWTRAPRSGGGGAAALRVNCERGTRQRGSAPAHDATAEVVRGGGARGASEGGAGALGRERWAYRRRINATYVWAGRLLGTMVARA
jgi:hypothetical protein